MSEIATPGQLRLSYWRWAMITVPAIVLIGSLMGVSWATVSGLAVYGLLKKTVGIRLDPEQEYNGADLSIHRITATPDREVNW